MQRLFRWMKEELIGVVPAILFFLAAFSLVDFTEMVVHKKEAHTYYSFFVIFISACLMGKVLIISNSLPFISLFSKKPLIYGTLWKTFIYLICTILVRFLEHGIPLLVAGHDLTFIYFRLADEIASSPFWLAELWLSALILVFVAYQELVFAVGPDKVIKLFFYKK